MSKVVPPPVVDEFEGVDHSEVECDIDRSFWLPYLRDLHHIDPEVLEEKPDSWIYARAKECMDNR